MNTIYDLVVSIVGNPPTDQAETVLYIVSGVLFLFIGFQFWMILAKLFNLK